jgi:hypothetical protein
MGRIAALVIGVIVALSTAPPMALVGAQAAPTDVDLDFTASDLGVVLSVNLTYVSK